MPLPLIPLIIGGVAAGAAATGIKKGLDAKEKNEEAASILEQAQKDLDSSKRRFSYAKGRANGNLQILGLAKAELYDGPMKNFLDVFSKITNIDYSAKGIEEAKLFSDKAVVDTLKKNCEIASGLVGGMASGVASGALTAFGAYSGVGLLGTASTGAAIGSLGGAAATNATLAWLGGGAIAAGGGGVAVGTAVLGGIVAGPAIAVAGFMLDKKAETNLNKAKSQRAKARTAIKNTEILIEKCNAIKEQALRYTKLARAVEEIFDRKISDMKQVINQNGTNYTYYTDKSKETIATTLSVASIAKAILDIPILTEDGSVTNECQQKYSALKERTDKFLSK